jgi:hypothetical protein
MRADDRGRDRADPFDLLIPELQQIAKRRAPVPTFRDVQLARWLAESCRHQHGRNLRPRDVLLADWKQPRAQLLKTGAAPQRERQVHVAELTRALDANALHSHRHRQLLAVITEQLHLFGAANQPTRQRPRLQPPLPVELTEMGHRLLNDATTDTNAAHKAPIAVNLPVLFANRMAQIHAPSEPTAPPKKIPKVVTTRSNQLRAPANRLIRFIPRLAKSQKPPPSCASWASYAPWQVNQSRMRENPGSSGSHHPAERCRHEIVCQHRIATKRQGGVQIALKRRPDFLLLA